MSQMKPEAIIDHDWLMRAVALLEESTKGHNLVKELKESTSFWPPLALYGTTGWCAEDLVEECETMYEEDDEHPGATLTKEEAEAILQDHATFISDEMCETAWDVIKQEISHFVHERG